MSLQEKKVKAKMKSLKDSIARLREKRDELRNSDNFMDQQDAKFVDKRIGRKQDKLEKLENENPTIAQKI